MTTTVAATDIEPEEIGPDTRLIREITLRNLLSFGPDTEPLALGPLNVLIGPNGSGKSNLIDAISLLRAAARDLGYTLQQGGGALEWVGKSHPNQPASLEVVITRIISNLEPLRYTLSFVARNDYFFLWKELIEDPISEHKEIYDWRHGKPVAFLSGPRAQGMQELRVDTVRPDSSILSQRRDPETLPFITFLAEAYEKFRIYRDWTFGRNTVFRLPQRADLRNQRLEEDFSNLGLILNRLRRTSAKSVILEHLRDLYDGVLDFDVSIEGGTVQVFLTERGSDGREWIIPATRLSDGTLRYLCLLAILCDPNPPPLICLEEPELGLHPDLLPGITDLLIDASTRTQLIVTTHSNVIVDALTPIPEAVIVCEKHNHQTRMQRLNEDDLKVWLAKYSLGQLWSSGQIGGNRW